MTPGPTIIRKCSGCGGLIAQRTIASGNTIGARFWTDGKMDAPMLPDNPRLVKCPHCDALVWIDEQEQVGEIIPWDQPEEASKKFKDARHFLVPSMEEYLDFLEGGVSNPQKERYVRLRAWWAGNDDRRESEHPEPMSESEAANLRAFATLLDQEDPNDRIMKGEALREIEMFEEAEALLEESFHEDLMQAVAIIRDLARRRVSAVREMHFE